MKALSLFSGIGGLDLAAEAAGFETTAFCEIEPFCQKILRMRWPNVKIHEDVRNVNWGGQYRGTVDIVFGGFPCQDLSVAGKQAGLEGARSGLWFEMLGAVEAIRPRFVVAENVRGAVNLALDTVQDGLETANYEVWTFLLPAVAFGAPHRRERLFIVGIRNDVADAYRKRMEGRGKCGEICGMRAQSSDGATGCSSSVVADAGSVLLPWRFERRNVQETRRTGLAADAKLSGCAPERSETGGQLNPDWVEQMMNFPEGWTDTDCKEPKPWQGWPAPLGARLWMTPNAGACGMTATTTGRPFEKSTHLQAQTYCAEKKFADQYLYEFPRTTKVSKNRVDRLRALGNAVVPAQAYPIFRAIAEIEKGAA